MRHLPKFCQEDSSAIIAYSINYSIGQIKNGKLAYSKELFALYKTLVEQLKIYEERHISHTDFNNVIEAACKTGELDWAEEFVEQYKTFIQPEDLRESSLSIGKALISFEKKSYAQVIALLNQVKFADMDHAIRARWLLLCSHFEEYPEAKQFEDFADAYYMYFFRNEIWHENTIKGSLNLLKFLRKMCKPYDADKLKQEIIATTPLVYKIWLLKKIDPHFLL